MRKRNRYLKNDYQFFDTLKAKDRKIRKSFNLLIKVKLHELEWSFQNPNVCLEKFQDTHIY